MYDRSLVNCVNNIAQINNDCVPMHMTSPEGKKHDIPMSNFPPISVYFVHKNISLSGPHLQRGYRGSAPDSPRSSSRSQSRSHSRSHSQSPRSRSPRSRSPCSARSRSPGSPQSQTSVSQSVKYISMPWIVGQQYTAVQRLKTQGREWFLEEKKHG